jgi:signal transduction histidine kinase
LKLQTKLALYNAISKAAIIAAIGVLLPIILHKVVYNHIDHRLRARAEKMMLMIQRGGISEIITEQDCSFNDYNIFKEEYVSIIPLKALPRNFGVDTIFDAQANIENEMVNHRILSKSFLYDNQLYEMNIGEGLTTVQELDTTLRRFSITILIIVVLASIFIDIGFAEILLRPFYKIINRKLQNVHHPSKFNEESIKTNTYEFAYLDESINEMMAKVKNAFLTEREFITNVSHELLTPISILQNRCENILSDPALPQNIAIKIVETQKTLSRLSRIVKALLYISKIENEQFAKNETVSIQSTVKDVLEEIEERLTNKNITVSQVWSEDLEATNANKSLLHTMLFNLVSNAIKYNKDGGEIIITGRKENQVYALSVKDTGVGIAKEHLPYIFDRFKRFRPEDEASYGLGLPIIQSIAEFHHLKINVESELHSGTVFTVYFPLQNTIQSS